jgi:glucokinase
MTLRGGIDLGGTKIQAVVVDARLSVVGSARDATPAADGPAAVAAAMADTLREASASAGIETGRLAAVGVGSPGSVDTTAGTVARSSNFADWIDPFPLAPVLSGLLSAPVTVGNDVDVATIAEHRLGAGRGTRSLLGVFWGTGVGSGIVIDDLLYKGRGTAGEIGHVVVRLGGRVCGCGRRGCMEAYAGRGRMEERARRLVERGERTRLFEIMHERGKTRLASGVWEQALAEGDRMAHALIDDAVEALGAAIGSAGNLLDVERVVIGGGLGTRLGQPLADRIGKAMRGHLLVPETAPDVLVAELGDLGGALGAAVATLPARR